MFGRRQRQANRHRGETWHQRRRAGEQQLVEFLDAVLEAEQRLSIGGAVLEQQKPPTLARGIGRRTVHRPHVVDRDRLLTRDVGFVNRASRKDIGGTLGASDTVEEDLERYPASSAPQLPRARTAGRHLVELVGG
jgi:hypothetical protein